MNKVKFGPEAVIRDRTEFPMLDGTTSVRITDLIDRGVYSVEITGNVNGRKKVLGTAFVGERTLKIWDKEVRQDK